MVVPRHRLPACTASSCPRSHSHPKPWRPFPLGFGPTSARAHLLEGRLAGALQALLSAMAEHRAEPAAAVAVAPADAGSAQRGSEEWDGDEWSDEGSDHRPEPAAPEDRLRAMLDTGVIPAGFRVQVVEGQLQLVSVDGGDSTDADEEEEEDEEHQEFRRAERALREAPESARHFALKREFQQAYEKRDEGPFEGAAAEAQDCERAIALLRSLRGAEFEYLSSLGFASAVAEEVLSEVPETWITEPISPYAVPGMRAEWRREQGAVGFRPTPQGMLNAASPQLYLHWVLFDPEMPWDVQATMVRAYAEHFDASRQ